MLSWLGCYIRHRKTETVPKHSTFYIFFTRPEQFWVRAVRPMLSTAKEMLYIISVGEMKQDQIENVYI